MPQYDKNIPVLDHHCHVCFPQRVEDSVKDYIKLYEELGIYEAAILSCPPSSHNDTYMDKTENLKVLYLKDKFPFPAYAYASFDTHWDDPEKYAEFAKQMLAIGYDGFKSMEQHPRCRKEFGKGLNHPSFAGFFHVLNDAGCPMVYHVGDPRNNWCQNTADASAVKSGRVYGPDFLSLDELYSETEEVIAKYPRINFVLAHFYFTSDNYDRACALMEKYPNMHFDLAPGGEMFVNFSKDPEKWREFFIRYRTRILMGGDHYPMGYARPRYNLARDFLEGTEPTEYRGDPVLPISLPRNVLDDIYWNNAHRLAGKPKTINRKLAYEYGRSIQEHLADQLSELGKENLQTIMAHFAD